MKKEFNIEYIVACCVCYKIKDDNNNWIEDNVLYTKLEEQGYISHGYCPPCLEKAIKEI